MARMEMSRAFEMRKWVVVGMVSMAVGVGMGVFWAGMGFWGWVRGW